LRNTRRTKGVCEPGEEDQQLPYERVKIHAPEARIQAEETDLLVDLKTEEEIEARILPIRAIITKEHSLVAELPEET
jgi:hypothetical protein